MILSNINEESIEGTIRNNIDVGWDAVYTAQRIGSYKPDLRNFEFLIEHVVEDLGVKKEEILHTAQSEFPLLIMLDCDRTRRIWRIFQWDERY